MALGGNVFDVKRFAVHDGPGVRTVLFLKGCPLRCRWCHNPEGIGTRPLIAQYNQKCLYCGECVVVCRQHAHAMVGSEHAFDRSLCIGCGACVSACPARALKVYGREIPLETALAMTMEDRDFHRHGGGITLSGGEPLLQAEFCAALLGRLKERGVHCAIDTCGAVEWDRFEMVLPHIDLVLFDLKHIDDRMHRQFTGMTNQGILGNLHRLIARRIPVEIRIPVVPGFNDNEDAIDGICAFLGGLTGITCVSLLPYHTAHNKYESLGLTYAMSETESMAKDRMDDIVAIVRRRISLQVRQL